MLNPRIVSHNSKEGISSRGNDNVLPPSSKGNSPPGSSASHPYKNLYSVKNHKLAKLNGLPPASSKHNGNLILSE